MASRAIASARPDSRGPRNLPDSQGLYGRAPIASPRPGNIGVKPQPRSGPPVGSGKGVESGKGSESGKGVESGRGSESGRRSESESGASEAKSKLRSGERDESGRVWEESGREGSVTESNEAKLQPRLAQDKGVDKGGQQSCASESSSVSDSSLAGSGRNPSRRPLARPLQPTTQDQRDTQTMMGAQLYPQPAGHLQRAAREAGAQRNARRLSPSLERGALRPPSPAPQAMVAEGGLPPGRRTPSPAQAKARMAVAALVAAAAAATAAAEAAEAEAEALAEFESGSGESGSLSRRLFERAQPRANATDALFLEGTRRDHRLGRLDYPQHPDSQQLPDFPDSQQDSSMQYAEYYTQSGGLPGSLLRPDPLSDSLPGSLPHSRAVYGWQGAPIGFF